MNLLSSILVLLAALISVYAESSFNGFRHVFGAQIDLLPPLIVYTALRTNLATVSALAVIGGLCFDSLSANVLGVTVMPLFLVGFVIYLRRSLILQDQFYAQFVLGAAAGAIVPLLVVLMLLSGRQSPALGWGSLWQWIVLSAGGGLMTPICFCIFGWLDNALTYRPVAQTSFRDDREIERGRK